MLMSKIWIDGHSLWKLALLCTTAHLQGMDLRELKTNESAKVSSEAIAFVQFNRDEILEVNVKDSG